MQGKVQMLKKWFWSVPHAYGVERQTALFKASETSNTTQLEATKSFSSVSPIVG